MKTPRVGLGLDRQPTATAPGAANRLERVMGQKEKDVQLKNTQEKVSGLEQELQLLQQELARVGREKKGTGESGDNSSDSSTANQARSPIPLANRHSSTK